MSDKKAIDIVNEIVLYILNAYLSSNNKMSTKICLVILGDN